MQFLEMGQNRSLWFKEKIWKSDIGKLLMSNLLMRGGLNIDIGIEFTIHKALPINFLMILKGPILNWWEQLLWVQISSARNSNFLTAFFEFVGQCQCTLNKIWFTSATSTSLQNYNHYNYKTILITKLRTFSAFQG